jgi:hypothetical protein
LVEVDLDYVVRSVKVIFFHFREVVGGFFFELFDENPVFGDFAQSLTIR